MITHEIIKMEGSYSLKLSEGDHYVTIQLNPRGAVSIEWLEKFIEQRKEPDSVVHHMLEDLNDLIDWFTMAGSSSGASFENAVLPLMPAQGKIRSLIKKYNL